MKKSLILLSVLSAGSLIAGGFITYKENPSPETLIDQINQLAINFPEVKNYNISQFKIELSALPKEQLTKIKDMFLALKEIIATLPQNRLPDMWQSSAVTRKGKIAVQTMNTQAVALLTKYGMYPN